MQDLSTEQGVTTDEKRVTLPHLDRLAERVRQTAEPQKVTVFTDPDHPELVPTLARELGLSQADAARMEAENRISRITTYPSRLRTGSCTVVFPAEIRESLEQPLPKTFRELYSAKGLGPELAKFAAFHEGAHCRHMELVEEMGIGIPRTAFGKAFQTSIVEAYADMVGALHYLREAAQNGRLEEGRKTILALRKIRHESQNVTYDYAASLLKSAAQMSSESLLSVPPEKLHILAKAAVINGAKEFYDWLLGQ